MTDIADRPMDLSALRADPENPRTITKPAADGLRHSLATYGDLSGIVWNKRTGELVCGHQRMEQLRALGVELADGVLLLPGGERFSVRVVDWPREKQRTANVVANNPEIAGSFTPELKATLEAVKALLPEQEYKLLALDKLEPADFGASVEEDEVPGPPKNPVSRTGDTWLLGGHRLLCGSCEDLASIVEQRSVRLMVTDPPYGVDYASKNEFLIAVGRGNRIQEPIEGDRHTPDEMSVLWRQWFSSVRPLLVDGASYYVTGPQGGDLLLLLLLLALRDSGYPLRHMLVWAKNNHVLGRSDYHYQHEPIVYGWVDGAAHHAVVNRSETSLWQINKPQKSDLHPTMKPVALYARAIQNSSDKGDAVLDPFGGSGTCVVACEQTERICSTSEIALPYCDVIVERWENLTGGKARRTHGVD